MLILTVGGTSARLERRSRCGTELLGQQIDGTDLSDAFASLAPLARRRWSRRCRLELEPPLIQTRISKDLPPVSSRQLAAAVRAQPERYFRPAPGGLVTTAFWVVDKASGQRAATLVGADAAVVAALIAMATKAGFQIDRVVPSTWPAGDIELMPEAERVKRARGEVRRTVGQALVLVGVWVVMAGVAAIRLTRERGRLEEMVASNRPAAESVRRAMTEVESVERAVVVVDSLRAARGILIAQIAALSAALPHDARLLRLDVFEDSTVVAGVATSQGAVVDALRRMVGFDSVRVAAPKARSGSSALGAAPFELTLVRAGRNGKP